MPQDHTSTPWTPNHSSLPLCVKRAPGLTPLARLPRIMRILYAGDVRIEVGRNARKPGLSPPYDPLVDALGGLKPTSFSIPHIA